MTMIAGFVAGKGDFLADPKAGFQKFDCNAVPNIRAAPRAVPLPRGSPAEAEEIAENIGEINRLIIERAGRPADTRFSETIVRSAFIRIGENLIRFVNFLELIFRVRILVDIRMILPCVDAECVPDFVRRRAPPNS